MTTNRDEVLIELQPYLIHIATSIVSNYHPECAVDDVVQEMSCHILERARREPDFLDLSRNTPAYIVQSAAWAARNWCNPRRKAKAGNYGRHRELYVIDEERDDGVDFAETMPAEQPDVDLVLDVRQALAGLGDKAREIARLLAAGYKDNELAEKAGLSSRQAVNYYRKQIRQALAHCVAA